MSALPIEEIASALSKECEAQNSRIVIKAPTGSGKSTRVPVIIQHASNGKVLVVQPRRMAARLLARFVAGQEKTGLGDGVGYAVRFDSKYKRSTGIVFVTDGVLGRMLQSDPELSEFDAVVFDEFHERRLASDVALARCVQIQEEGRSDLRIVVMSATLAVDTVTDFLGDCKTYEVSGRAFPVDQRFTSPPLLKRNQPAGRREGIWSYVLKACKSVVDDPDVGNILIFLPGVFEINRTIRELESATWLKAWEIYPLYSALSPNQQEAAVSHSKQRKIVVSTNVAETSLTIPGIRTVIDSGLARVARFDSRRGMNALLVEPISQAAAEQRAGRAGRVAPGQCIRLWSQSNHSKRAKFEEAEVHRVELSEVLLQLISAGEDPQGFPWVEKPREESMAEGLAQLQRLDAIDEFFEITELGSAMATLPLEPRLARLVLAGRKFGCLNEAIFLSAALQGEGIFVRKRTNEQIERFQMDTDYSDFTAEWRAWMAAAKCNYDTSRCSEMGIMARVAREWTMTIRQLAKHELLKIAENGEINLEHREELLIQALLRAFSDRLACRLSESTLSCRVVGKRRGKIDAHSMAKKSSVFIVTEIAEVEGKALEVKLSRCAGIGFKHLEEFSPEGFHDEQVTEFDSVRKKISSLRRRMFQDLVIEEVESADVDSLEIAHVLAKAVLEGKLKWAGFNDSVEQWISRVNLFSVTMPEMEISSIGDEEKQMLLEQAFEGVRMYKEIKSRTLDAVMKDWLSPAQWQVIDSYVPTSISLTNGRNAKIRYQEDGSARIALRVQQLYGVEETPTIMQGRKKLLVEILAPNQRPWQITEDLAGFWKSGFEQMKKDLAGRYPKHDWRS